MTGTLRAQYQPASVPEVSPEPTIPSGPVEAPSTPADPTMPEPDTTQDRLAA